MRTRIPALFLAISAAATVSLSAGTAPPRAVTARPLWFEQNGGQADASALYLARGRGFVALFGSDEVVLRGAGDADAAPVRMRFAGAQAQRTVTGDRPLPTKSYYATPGHDGPLTAHSTFARVRYTSVYPGIDIVYYGNDHQLEFDLVVAPGADPSVIAMVLDGATDLEVASNGDLRFHAGSSRVTLRRPVVYQEHFNVRTEVIARYVVSPVGHVGFAFGEYDASQPLIVDPIFLFNSDGNDVVRGVEVDAAGKVFLLGETTDPAGYAWDRVESGFVPGTCYLAKMDPASATPEYTILFSGTSLCSTLALSPSGVAYFPGYEGASGPGLHVTTVLSVDDSAGVPQIRRLRADNYSPIRNQVGALAVDSLRNVYLLGVCRVVTAGTPPLTLSGFNDAPDAGSGQPTCVSGSTQEHALLTKLAPNGDVEYATFLASDDVHGVAAASLAVDDQQRVYVVRQSSAAVPVTAGAFRDTCPAFDCGYLMIIDSTTTGASSLVQATYLWPMSPAGRQVVRLAAPSSVYIGSDGPFDSNFPTTNFDPYPDFERLAAEGPQLARFNFDGSAVALEMSRTVQFAANADVQEKLIDVRVLPSGAAAVGVIAEGLDATSTMRFDVEVFTYYRSGVLESGNPFIVTMFPGGFGDPTFAMATTATGQAVIATEQLQPSGMSDVHVEIGTATLDPGPNTPPTLVVSPRQVTVDSYDPTGAIVPGFVAAFDWDENANQAVGIADNCTHHYNITRFPVGTTHVVCTPTDDAGLTITDGYDVTVNLVLNTTAANTPIALTDQTGPPTNIHTPGRVTATFLGTVDQTGLTWLRTRTDQQPVGPPAGLQLGSAPFYYDIGTTAATTGEINLCFDITGMTFVARNAVRLHQLGVAGWVDLNQTTDLAANQVCTVVAEANELGTFALFTPADERTRVEILAGVGSGAGQWPLELPPGDGGPATAAALGSPSAVAFDMPRQAMYIADGTWVRRVDLQTGIITRYAGVALGAPSEGVFGNPVEGRLATETPFLQIDDIAVDRDGNVFIAQRQNCVIQRIDRVTNIVRNIAGAWLGDQPVSCGHTGDGGEARSAKISNPFHIAFDADGNLLFGVIDGLPQQIHGGTPGYLRRIAAGADQLIKGRPEETISTIAGNGTSTPVAGSPLASGMSPFMLAVGRDGEVYVGSNSQIIRIVPAPGQATVTGAPGETLSIVAGGDLLARLPFQGDGGHPLDADLLGISDIEVMPAGELLISHYNTRRIRRITPGADGVVNGSVDERIATLAGFAELFLPPGPLDLSDYSPTDYALSAYFVPSSATVDPRGGIVVADSGRYYVRRFGYAPSTLTLSPPTLDFGLQLLNTTSTPRTVIVSNHTDGPLSVTGVSASGDFAVVGSACGVLAAGANCAIELSFTPTAVGPRSGELQVTDSTTTVHRVSLTGRGRGLPVVQLTPPSLTFASQLAGTTSAPQTVTLANIGQGDLLIGSITVVGTDFVQMNTCPATLTAGSSCTIDVSLRPLGSSPGLRSGELRIVSDAAGSPHAVSLTGFGDTRLLSVSPAQVEFGLVDTGSTTAPITVTLTNAGSTPLSLGAIAVTGDTTAGVIDTFAGNGQAPTDFTSPWQEGAPATGESIGFPTSIGVDGRGNVFFVSQSRVGRIDALTRTIRTVWRNGDTAGVADGGGPLRQPQALAVARSGHVYVAEGDVGTRGSRIRRIDAATGAITVVAGALLPPGAPRGDGGPALAAALEVVALAVDGAGNLFLADDPVSSSSLPGTIRRVDAVSGIITRIAGGGTSSNESGPPTTLTIFPNAVAVDAAGNVFVREYGGFSRIRRIDASTGLMGRFGVNPVLQFSRATIAVDPDGNLIVANDRQVLRFDGATANVTVIAGSLTATQLGDGGPATAAGLSSVHAAVDSAGNIYVSDGNFNSLPGGSLRIRRIEAGTTNASQFPLNHTCGSILGLGESCTATVSFAAASAGPHRATIAIAHDGTGAPAAVPMVGIGAAPRAIVSPTLKPFNIPVRTLTFRDTVVGTSSTARVVVGNGGNAPLPLPATVFQFGGVGPFTLQPGTCEPLLPPGARCEAIVIYSPTTTGTHTSSMQVMHGVPPTTVDIMFDGPAVPGLSVSPTQVDFNTVVVGSTSTRTVSIGENASVSLTSVAITGAHASEFELSACTPPRPPGMTGPWPCNLSITFRPADHGPRSAQLDIVGSLGFQAVVPLAGFGATNTGSQLVVTPASVTFGAATVGSTLSSVVTLSNPGPQPVSISQIAAAGQQPPLGLTTVAGDGTSLGEVYDVALDAGGNRYLADATRHRVWRLNVVTGSLQAIAGTGVAGSSQHPTGQALLSQLNGPTSVAVDQNGHVYVADTGNHVVRRISPSGSISVIAGTGAVGYSGDGGHASAALLGEPTGLAIDAIGNLLITDSLYHVIRRVDAVNGIITTVVGDGVAGTGLGTMASDPLRLHTPFDVAVTPDGDWVIADFGNSRVLRVERPDGPNRQVTVVTSALAAPVAVAMNAIGRIYVSHLTDHRVLTLLPDNLPTIAAGNGTSGWLDSSDPSSGRLSAPRGLAVDVTGHLLIADSGNRRLRQVTAPLPTPFGVFLAGPGCVRTLQVGESCDVNVSFTPAHIGLNRGTLQIVHDALAGPDSVPLAGVGTRGRVYTGVRPVFRDVEVGTTASGSVRIVNSGNGPLQLTNVTVTSDTPPNPFTSSSDCPATLAAGEGCTLQVTFAPTRVGFPIGRIAVTHDGDPVMGANAIFTSTVPARTQTTLSSSGISQSVFGEPITFTVAVTSPFGTPAGAVTFSSNGVPIMSPGLTLAGGTGSLTTTTLPAGSYAIEARYGGDPVLHAPSVSPPLAYVVAKQSTSIALDATPTSPVYGQPVVLAATVASATGGAITGAIQFTDGAAPLSPPVALNGILAGLTVVPNAGVHTFAATYLGDPNSEQSVSTPITMQVAQAASTTTLTTDANPAFVNFPVTFTATVVPQHGGVATGTVTFRSWGTVLAVVPVTGNAAVLTRTFTSQQSANVTASYSGDVNVSPSTSAPLFQQVRRVPTITTLTYSPNPVFAGQALIITITVSSEKGAPPDGQQVRLTGAAQGAPIMLNLSGGTASYTTSSLQAGFQWLQAIYSGNSTFDGSNDAEVVQVQKQPTTIALTSSPSPSTYGQAVTFEARVSSPVGPLPDGERITFGIPGVQPNWALVSGGVARLTTSATALPVGPRTAWASYAGNATFAASQSPTILHVVNGAPTTTTVSASAVQMNNFVRVTLTAEVASSVPGVALQGTVTFRAGNQVLGSANVNGQGRATLQTTSLPRGTTHTITATYNPSGTNLLSSVGTVTVFVP